jgi:hypothetical protein
MTVKGDLVPDRAVEVIYDRGEDARPRWLVGPGWLVGGRLVLTAAHCVGGRDGRGSLLVRRHLDDRRHADYKAVLATEDGERAVGPEDLAVLEIVDPRFDGIADQVRYGVVDRSRPHQVKQCWGVGFPHFKERLSQDGPAPLRDTQHLSGVIHTASNLVTGLLEFQVTSRPTDPTGPGELDHTPWQGMSGTAVFADDPEYGTCLLGVVSEHHPLEGSSSLTVVPIVDVASRTLGVCQRTLGIVNIEDLRRLPSGDDSTPRRDAREGQASTDRPPRLVRPGVAITATVAALVVIAVVIVAVLTHGGTGGRAPAKAAPATSTANTQARRLLADWVADVNGSCSAALPKVQSDNESVSSSPSNSANVAGFRRVIDDLKPLVAAVNRLDLPSDPDDRASAKEWLADFNNQYGQALRLVNDIDTWSNEGYVGSFSALVAGNPEWRKYNEAASSTEVKGAELGISCSY